MKKTLILLTALTLTMSLATIAGAVEKKEKAAGDKKQPSAESKDQKKPAPLADSIKKYDNFVDNNKNGIDDRSENLKPKKDNSAAKSTVSKKPDKKPAVTPIKVEPKKEEPKGKKPN